MPEGALRWLSETVLIDSLPFLDSATIKPFPGGNESAGWDITTESGSRYLCKVDRCDIDSLRGNLSFSDMLDDNAYIEEAHGPLAHETSFVFLRQPYNFGGPAIARIQPMLDVAGDLFEAEPRSLNQSDLRLFIANTYGAITNDRIPDILGYGNVVYDTNGQIRIVDTTITRSQDFEPGGSWDQSIEKFSQFVAKMSLLEADGILG